MPPKKKEQNTSHHRGLNAVVYSLLVLAVVLGGIAGWQRYSQRQGSETSDALDRRIDTVLSNLGIIGSWVPTGGPGLNTPTGRMSGFVCPQCQSACWTHARIGCPACPFCGLAMVRQGVNPQGVRISLVGGAGAGGTTLPTAIRANALCPHADRGACTNCHTVVRSRGAWAARRLAGAAQSAPKPRWQGVAAPAIPADAVRPALIQAFGMEVCPAPGAGARVTGVMGNSYASRAGLRAGDVIIGCNGTRVRDVGQLQQLVSQAPPETDAQLKILRNGRTRDLSIMVGEGEMEGFTPIRRP